MVLNIQFFGGRGASAGTGKKNATPEKNGKEKALEGYKGLEGQNVDILNDVLEKIKFAGADSYFDVKTMTLEQASALRQVFRGMIEHDNSYGHKDRPYKIESISVEALNVGWDDEEEAKLRRSLGMRKTAPPIQVSITTVPNDDNAYVRMADTKRRSFLIGAKGGYYTYGKGGKKKKLKSFDVQYGKDL